MFDAFPSIFRFYSQVTPLLPTTMNSSTSAQSRSNNPSAKPMTGLRARLSLIYLLIFGLALTFIIFLFYVFTPLGESLSNICFSIHTLFNPIIMKRNHPVTSWYFGFAEAHVREWVTSIVNNWLTNIFFLLFLIYYFYWIAGDLLHLGTIRLGHECNFRTW